MDIPFILKVLNVEHIKFPIAFQTKEEMGQGFTQLTPDWASKFISDAIEYIKENRRKVEEETLQSRLNQSYFGASQFLEYTIISVLILEAYNIIYLIFT
jgi:hypothetical protein